jgi:steroid 5-alpha reductase family enzyme
VTIISCCRSSETQRCEFAKDPANPSLAHLETLSTAGNKKLIVSGWWGLVRHPNYLGEVLIQWSWVLPAGDQILHPSDNVVFQVGYYFIF